MSNSVLNTVLVTGATGMQGNSVAKKLISDGYSVKVLTTNSCSEKAQELSKIGAVICEGNFEDSESLDRALVNVDAVFSLQLSDPSGQQREVTHVKALIKSAQKAGVRHFIQSTVSGAGQHAESEWFKSKKWPYYYWNDKKIVQDEVIHAGFERYTILKPALFMENLLPPKVSAMYIGLESGRLITRVPADIKIAWISSETLANAVLFSLKNPDIMNGCELELADALATPVEVAKELTAVTGTFVSYEQGDHHLMLEMGFRSGVLESQEWLTEVGYPARPDMAQKLGVNTLTFHEWATLHAAEFKIG